ncbi:hypothetical protein [uncultured Succinivibrio sp.]|uniref:hypothetical protein n=1 Tax=uncultured Succinivibrio sp. TaxID=540749 RepID=UPI0025D11E30|nr:hypothetical protein [uncultured Succinivibrio sp.]
MSNIPFEPKDGDYVSLIERLGRTSIDEIKDEIYKSQKEHQQHAGVLNSPSIEKTISQKNLNRSPAQAKIPGTTQNTTPAQSYSNTTGSGSVTYESAINKILKVLLFIGFLFAATITGVIAVTVDTEDEEIILFPMIVYIIFVAVVSSKLSKRKSTKEK